MIGRENFSGLGCGPGLGVVVRFLLKEVHQDWVSSAIIYHRHNLTLHPEIMILSCADSHAQDKEWDECETDHSVPAISAWLEIVTQLTRCFWCNFFL